MNRFKRIGILVAAVCTVVMGAIAPAHAADFKATSSPVVEQQTMACDPPPCTQDFSMSNPGVSSYSIFRFYNNYQVYYDVNLWDTECDSRSAVFQYEMDLQGVAEHKIGTHENGNGCGTRRDWFDAYVGTDQPILAVRVRGCRWNSWTGECFPWSGWKTNPAYSSLSAEELAEL